MATAPSIVPTGATATVGTTTTGTTTTGTTTTVSTTTTVATTTTTPSGGTASAEDPISALSSSSITVGPLTCQATGASPNLTSFHVGDRVHIGCTGGILTRIEGPLPAPNAQVVQKNGNINAVSSSSITVDGLTCSVGAGSPTTGSFTVGQRVVIACVGQNLVYLVAAPSNSQSSGSQGSSGESHSTSQMVVRMGVLTALSSTSITVSGLTCTIGSTSPSTAGFTVGGPTGIGCINGALVKIGVPSAGSSSKGDDDDDDDDKVAELKTSFGAITALTTTSVTIGTLTCTIAQTSPSVAAFKVGDQAGIGCRNGVLVKIGIPGAAQGGEMKTAFGPITALSSSAVTIGTLTCTITQTSPSTASYKVGDVAGIGCIDSKLVKIGTPPGTTDGVTVKLGTVSAVSSSSITVGPLTCTVGAGSPSVAGFKVGDQAGIGCFNGVLFMIGVPPANAGAAAATGAPTNATVRFSKLVRQYTTLAKLHTRIVKTSKAHAKH